MKRYFAIVTKDADSDFSVLFPDFPGCYTAGTTLEEACDNMEEALGLHIAGMRAEGLDIPEPSSYAELAETRGALSSDAEFCCAVSVAPRSVKGRAVRVQITLDEYLLEEIDASAAALGETRSGFLATGARRRLEDA